MAVRLLAATCRTDHRRTAQAAAEPGDGLVAPCDRLVHAPDPDALTAVLQTLARTLHWPADSPAQHHALPFGAGRSANLVCSPRWWQAVGNGEAVIDLAAAATPAQWLQHLEDRLLDGAAVDPGPYAALAWWDEDDPPTAEAAR